MAYCLPADVAVYAPQVSDDLAGVDVYIADAQVAIDSHLRPIFEVPFADGAVDNLVKQLTARIAAGRWLRAHAQKVGNDGLIEHGRRLEEEAMRELRDLVANPSRIEVAVREDTEDFSGVSVAHGSPVFDLGDPTGWGRNL